MTGRKLTGVLAGLLLLASPLAAQDKIAFKSELPRTLVFIQEKGGGTVATTELNSFLAEAGFPLVDPALAHTVAQRELVQAALAGDEGAAVELGRNFGAHVLVLGNVDWGTGPNPAPGMENTVVGTADVTLRVLRLDAGKAVGSIQTARGEGMETSSATDQAAKTIAIRSALRKIINRSPFVGAIANNWQEQPWSPADYFKADPGSVGAAMNAAAAGPRLAIIRTDVLPPMNSTTRGIGVVKRAERGSAVKNDIDIEGVVAGGASLVDVEGVKALLSPLDDATRAQLSLGPDAQRFKARIALGQAQDTVHVVATAGGAKSTIVAAPRIGERWAVVVGVGQYASDQIPDLQYASTDAQAMYDFLRSPEAGPFPEDHILFLKDGAATNQAIREALFSFLQKAQWNDLVVIYFAGHGAPDPKLPDNLYLLPTDANVNALASTAFPMWDVKTALRRQIKAERVIVIADACHSGGAAGENPVGASFAELFTPSRRLTLTAAAENEQSMEDAKWGGGHGVFTYSILEALRGAADSDRNGIVTFAEVSDFVSRRVKTETSGRQNPQRSGLGDIPLAEVRPSAPAKGTS